MVESRDTHLIQLHHFTCMANLSNILSDGFLRTTESKVAFHHANGGPNVVWLTAQSTPEPGMIGLRQTDWAKSANPMLDKYRIRITVAVPRKQVVQWSKWAKAQRSSSNSMLKVVKASGGGARSYYVIERPVMRQEWIEIVDMETGRYVPMVIPVGMKTIRPPMTG